MENNNQNQPQQPPDQQWQPQPAQPSAVNEQPQPVTQNSFTQQPAGQQSDSSQPMPPDPYTPQPRQPAFGQFGDPSGQAYAPMGAKPKGRKKLVIFSAAGLAVLLLGSSAAAYFGYLVPNKPENIWATAMERTAGGYDKLVDYANSTKDLNTIKVDGNYKLSGAFASDGTIKGEADSKNASFKADFGVITTRLNVDVRMLDAANSTSPDTYFKVSGLKGVGDLLGDTTGTINGYDNQWYVADHTLIDTLLDSSLDESNASDGLSQLTDDDINQIAKAVGEVNRDYLFSTSTDKNVLTIVKKVGKEQQDGRDVYHFEVGLDKQHTKDYLNAMVAKLETTPVKKLLNGKKLKDAVNLDSLLKDVDKYNSADTADVFVDTATKTIRTVRFKDKSNAKNFLDVGVHYTGGDVVPFVLHFEGVEDGSDAKGTIDLGLSVNMKTNVSEFKMDFDVPTSGEPNAKHEKGTGTMTFTMNNDKVSVQKPTGAKSINELIGPLLGGGLGSSGVDDSNLDTLDPSSLLGGLITL